MSYAVVPLRITEHREALLRVWSENSYNPRANDCAAERFEWLYRDSPPIDAATWLAIESDSEGVIGCGSVFRSDRYFRGSVVRAGVPAVFFVDRRHRVAAPALAIQRALVAGSCKMGLDLLMGKPNRSARAVCDRIGYQTVGSLREWVRRLGADENLQAAPRAAGYADEIVSEADARFDELWHRGKDRFPMSAVKTRAFLNWRYSGFTENYRFYCLVRGADRQLAGYIVFYAMEDGAVVSDLFCEQPSGPVLEDLLRRFCAQLKTEGLAWVSISYAGPASFEESLRQAGFSRGRHERALLAYVNPETDSRFRTDVLDEHNWFVFGGEMDVLLSHEVWKDRGARAVDAASGDAAASA
jgi:hypothetical protein